MRRIEDPSNISLRCIKAIGKIATVQAERGDEEGVIKSIDSIMSILPKPTEDPIAQRSPQELHAKIDHILGWLNPLIERLEKKNE